MKTSLIKPGFEFIFALGLIAIIGLPPIVFAQDTKDVEIRITNGDTIVNGKNIKKLSPVDRKQALRDIENLGTGEGPQAAQHRIFIRKRGMADTGGNKIIIEKRRFQNGGRDGDMADDFHLKGDSTGRVFKFRMKSPGWNDSTFTFNYKMNDDPEIRFNNRERNFNFPSRGRGMEFGRRRNVQSFDYTNTGNDGISTHVSFRVTDPSTEKLKTMTRAEKAGLEIKDLSLVPEFSSGKTTLMFSLSSHGIAEVKFTDNEGKLIWSEKITNGSFNKSFGLGLNGVYFLQVKQAGKIALKRIIKE